MIRDVSNPDAAVIAGIVNAAFAVEREYLIPPTPDTPGRVRQIIAESRRCFVKLAQGRVVGWVSLSVRGNGHGLCRQLAIEPAFHRRGFGRELMRAIEGEAVACGFPAMDVTVLSCRPELRGFYEALGYRDTGETQALPDSTLLIPAHLILFRKSLA